jgi:hypothetical protein
MRIGNFNVWCIAATIAVESPDHEAEKQVRNEPQLFASWEDLKRKACVPPK